MQEIHKEMCLVFMVRGLLLAVNVGPRESVLAR